MTNADQYKRNVIIHNDSFVHQWDYSVLSENLGNIKNNVPNSRNDVSSNIVIPVFVRPRLLICVRF